MRDGGTCGFLQTLIILALFTAGVSPACKFISGQSSLIEICTIYGLRTIEVPDEENPATGETRTAEQCLFCYSAQIFKAAAADKTAKNFYLYEDGLSFALSRHEIPFPQSAFPFESRAPPVFS